jgi:hypothetical protein
MYRFACPNCNCLLEGPESKAGEVITCPKCREHIVVPMPKSRIIVTCPGCGRQIPLRPEELSIAIQCVRCDTNFVPTSPAPPPALLGVTNPGARPELDPVHLAGTVCSILSIIFGSIGCLGPWLGLFGVMWAIIGLVLSRNKTLGSIGIAVSVFGTATGMILRFVGVRIV